MTTRYEICQQCGGRITAREVHICPSQMCALCGSNDCDRCASNAPGALRDCACHRSGHSLAAACAVKDGADLIDGCETGPIEVWNHQPAKMAFNLTLKGREYVVTVEAEPEAE